MHNIALHDSTIVLLQEFWGYSKTDAKDLIGQAKEKLGIAVAQLDVRLKGQFLNNIKSHILTELLPTSFNVAVLNHGEINALSIAGKSISRFLKQNSNFNPEGKLNGKQFDFLFAVVIPELMDIKNPKSFIEKQSTRSDTNPTEFIAASQSSEYEPIPTLRFSQIVKWLFIGFLILFALCFLLLNLFS